MLVAYISNLCPLTLASGDSDGLGKLIFFGIVLVIWAGAAIANSLKQAAAKRRANVRPPSMNWQQPTAPAWPNVSPPPVPAARRPQARRVIPPPPIPRRSFAPPPPPRAPPPLPFSTAVIAPSPPAPDAPTPVSSSVRSAAPAVAPARSASPRPSSIGAADIRRWLTPEVLRGQYFVTEVFDPPPGALD